MQIALWHSFTLFYFGFPLQNAAYAKRFNNLPLGEYLRAGVDDYLNILQRDPITLPVILSGFVLGLRSRDNKLRCFVLGIGIYLVDILFIGGDYMSGRFFTVAYIAGVIAILRSDVLQGTESTISAIALMVILGCLAVHPTFTTGKTFGEAREKTDSSEWEQRGKADERSSWYQHSGLLLSSRLRPMPQALPAFDFFAIRDSFVAEVNSGKRHRVIKLIPTGYAGFYMPRDIHVYDTNGQVDPLMARLPIIVSREWKVGHLFKPDVPGYEQTLVTGVNKIVDPDVAAYYDKLGIITRGDLFSFERLLTIVKMNLGRCRGLNM